MPFCVIIMFTSFFTLCVLVQNLSERSRVESLRGDAAILPTTSAPRIIDIISATSFPIDSQTGKIILPKNITTVVLDIGARESDYLRVKEGYGTNDQSVALILIDPLPESSIPLMKRVAEYSMRDWSGGFFDQDKSNQIFLVRAAVGENEGIANLNIAAAPACTSMLKTSANNKFWCARSHSSIKVPVITLDGLLNLLPDTISNKQIHVKIDTEGADLAVLKGAARTLQRIDTVVIECNDDAKNQTFRDDECVASHALEYMKERGFKDAHVEEQGGLVNIFFARDDYHGPLPDYFLRRGLAMHKFYQAFNDSINI